MACFLFKKLCLDINKTDNKNNMCEEAKLVQFVDVQSIHVFLRMNNDYSIHRKNGRKIFNPTLCRIYIPYRI
jgi:hypothetical protein